MFATLERILCLFSGFYLRCFIGVDTVDCVCSDSTLSAQVDIFFLMLVQIMTNYPYPITLLRMVD